MTSYSIDLSGRILAVGGMWDDFALANGGARSRAIHVVGRPLWEFVAGTETVRFLKSVFFWARHHRMTLEAAYRCDSPHEARRFRMRILPQANEVLQVEHRSVAYDPIPHEMNSEHPARSFPRCSMCCRFRVDDGWTDLLKGPAARLHADSFVVCPDCRGALLNSDTIFGLTQTDRH